MRLKDKIALITGGARGIGLETAKHFIMEGAYTIIADINREALEEAMEILSRPGNVNSGNVHPGNVETGSVETGSVHPGNVETGKVHSDYIHADKVETGKVHSDNVHPCVEAITLDVTDFAAVHTAINTIVERHGRLDILFNNAGITSDAQLLKMTEEQFDRVIAVNLKGVFNCAHASAPHMVNQGYGKIINTSSVVAHDGNFGQTNYAATKAGVIAMTKTWSRELARKGIHVNAVAPGYTLTDMVKTVPGKVLEALAEKASMRRLGQPDEIASVVVFLASDESSYINGAVICADGGMTL